MIAILKPNGFGFHPNFEDLRRTLELQVFDHRHDVSIGQHSTIGVLDDAIRIGCVSFGFFGPLMSAGHAFITFSMVQNIGHLTHRAGRGAHRRLRDTKRTWNTSVQLLLFKLVTTR